jgi:GDSL-like Lipase/Acylhydrolase family
MVQRSVRETRSRVLGKFALLAASTPLALGLAELVVRVAGLAPDVTQVEIDSAGAKFVSVDDPVLKYVPRAGSGDINSRGFRDHEYPLEKPAGTYRIAVIGDSIAFGYCTDDVLLPIDDVFAKVLERRLNADVSRRQVEVINMSVSGYDTPQEVEFLEQKGLVFQPDLVVVAYCLNDRWEASTELGKLGNNQKWKRPISSRMYRWIFHHSSLVRFVWQRRRILKQKWHLDDKGHQPLPDDRVSVAFDRLRALSRQHAFAVLTVVFPLFEDYAAYTHLAEHERVRADSTARQFHYLDLLDSFRSHASPDFHALQGRCQCEHPDERGHALAAEEIERTVVKEILKDEGGGVP